MDCEKYKKIAETIAKEILKDPVKIEIAKIDDFERKYENCLYFEDYFRIVNITFDEIISSEHIELVGGSPMTKESKGFSVQSLVQEEGSKNVFVEEITLTRDIYTACKAVLTMITAQRMNPIIEMFMLESGEIKADA